MEDRQETLHSVAKSLVPEAATEDEEVGAGMDSAPKLLSNLILSARQSRPGCLRTCRITLFASSAEFFFNVSGRNNPQCTNCGGAFIQYIRSAQEQNWVVAGNAIAEGFAFDDQLDNSLSVSLNEAPMPKKPTKASFLQSLAKVKLDRADIEERALLHTSDPRSTCAICRDAFIVGDSVQKLPCNHEFHADCILLWLKGNNTCPICRLQLPEGVDGEEEQEAVKAEQAANERLPQGEEGDAEEAEAEAREALQQRAPRRDQAGLEPESHLPGCVQDSPTASEPDRPPGNQPAASSTEALQPAVSIVNSEQPESRQPVAN